jgi:HD-GYP domain-containing protein (c-di-GMP phosphodiesterase class II)
MVKTLSVMSKHHFQPPPIRFRHAAFFAGAIFLAISALVIFVPPSETRLSITDGISPLINFTATAALVFAARRSAGQSRRLGLGWGILATAQLCYSIADLAWFILEVCLHQSPYPSIADVFYLAYDPLFLLGVLLLPGRRFSPRGWLEIAIDLAIIMVVASLGFWNLLLGPIALSGGGDSGLVQLLGLAYPVGDLILFWALLALAYRRNNDQDHGPIHLLIGCLIAMIITDCIYSYQALAGTYQSGSLVDMGYVLTVLMACLAGALQADIVHFDYSTWKGSGSPEAVQDHPGRWQTYFPYLWVILAILLLIYATTARLSMSTTRIAIGVGVVIGLVLVRQLIAFAENARLFKQLQQSASRLEQKTQETERHLQHLTILRSIDQAILTSPGMEGTLDNLLQQITTQMDIDAANILLYQPATQTLEISAMRGLKSSIYRETCLRLGESHAGQVALERKMEIITDLSRVDDSMTTRISQSGERFLGYAALPLVAKGEIKGVLQLFQCNYLDPTQDWIDFLCALADQAAIAIDNAQLFDHHQRSKKRLMLAYDDTIDGWSRALDLRDRETEGHSQRVTEHTLKLARKFGIPEVTLPHVRRGAQLHDIGKMGIPDSILLKPGPLTEEEWKIMRLHPQYAYDLLSPIDYLVPALDIPYSHHERWDGSGYPRQLKGEEIPLVARIFAVVDVWDALCHDRPYRPAWAAEKAIAYLQAQAGIGLDPQVVSAYLELID